MANVDDFLSHHGVKGMKWGQRKSTSGPTQAVVVSKPGKKLKTAGGAGHAPTSEALSAALIRQKAKKSSVDSLSNQELQDVVKRMNLERQYNTLKIDRASPGAKFVSKLLVDTGKQQVTAAVNDQAKKARAGSTK